jgi:hypothetical protein
MRKYKGFGVGKGSPNKASGQYFTYLPGLDAFCPTTMDVYSGGSFPPGGGARESGVNILLTGTFMEGTRSRVAGGDLLHPYCDLRHSH